MQKKVLCSVRVGGFVSFWLVRVVRVQSAFFVNAFAPTGQFYSVRFSSSFVALSCAQFLIKNLKNS